MGSLAPKFGDVYRLAGDKLFVLFLRRQPDGEWLGIPLNGLRDNVLELYVAFDRGVWEFVEHIDGHAAGGYTPGGPMATTVAQYAAMKASMKGLAYSLRAGPSLKSVLEMSAAEYADWIRATEAEK